MIKKTYHSVVAYFAFTLSFTRSDNEQINHKVSGDTDTHTKITARFNSFRFDG